MDLAYIRFPQFRRKALTLSYDDGVRQDKRLIAILRQHGLKATFNINSGLFGATYDGVEKGRMTVQEALDLYRPAGMEVAIHGCRHLSLTRVAPALALDEIVSDRKALEAMFGEVITGMAYANGAFDDATVSLLQSCGVDYARTTQATERFDIPEDWLRLPATCHHNHPRLMELAHQFVEEADNSYFWRNGLRLFYLWGHSYEFDDHDNWNVIEEFSAYIGGHDTIWYATNGEIFRYLQACKRLQFSMDGSFVANPSALDVYLDFLGKQVLVPAGQTVSLR